MMRLLPSPSKAMTAAACLLVHRYRHPLPTAKKRISRSRQRLRTALDSHDTGIMLQERTLRIFKDTLGLHPDTALTMSNIGAAYGHKGQYKKVIELHEQALRIYERTVGRMHRHAAYAISEMSTAYYNLGDLVKAEELGKEALHIYKETLGLDHKETKEACGELDIIQKAKSRVGGALE